MLILNGLPYNFTICNYGLLSTKVLLSTSTVDMLMILFVFSTMSMDFFSSFNFSIHSIMTLGSLWKREQTIAFINKRNPTNLITSVNRKKTFTGLLTNFFSFTSFSCALRLVITLIDRAYKINNILLGFNEEGKKLSFIFKKKQFPEGLINKVLNMYLVKVNQYTALSVDSIPPDGIFTLYFKLPNLSWPNFTRRKMYTLVKRSQIALLKCEL